MIWLKSYIEKIRDHLDTGDAPSLTYAALEARLALERVCYERLRIAHKYISADDLRTWKPQYVVQTVMEMVSPKIVDEWTLQIGSQPINDPTDYITLGTQKGFDPKYINSLWHAMSSFLHCEPPRNENDPIGHYRPESKIKQKIMEALNELDRIAQGTIMGTTIFSQITFDCVCGQKNQRSTEALQNDDIINCIRQSCKEQYRVKKSGEEFSFERRVQHVTCHACSTPDKFPYRKIHEIKNDQLACFICSRCGEENTFMWRLMQVKKRQNEEPDFC